jgi:hypothetical protein
MLQLGAVYIVPFSECVGWVFAENGAHLTQKLKCSNRARKITTTGTAAGLSNTWSFNQIADTNRPQISMLDDPTGTVPPRYWNEKYKLKQL